MATTLSMLFERAFREDIDDVSPLNGSLASPMAARFGAGDVGWVALGPAIALSAFATLVVSLRWYSRCRIVRCVGLDDYVISLSLLLSYAMSGLIAAAVCKGVGSYSPAQDAVDTVLIMKLIISINSLWAITVNITKASILAQYLRVFSEAATRACCWFLLACLLPATCWAVFAGIFLCRPTAKLWRPALPGSCMSAQTYWVSVAGLDIGLDFLTLLLPMPSITCLHLPRKQKFATLFVFLLGFLVCAVSVARVGSVLRTSDQGDYVMSGLWTIIWSVVEANVGIVCASLLSLKCLVVKLFPRLLQEPLADRPSHRLLLPKLSSQDPVTSSPQVSCPESPDAAQESRATVSPPAVAQLRPARRADGGEAGGFDDAALNFFQMLRESGGRARGEGRV